MPRQGANKTVRAERLAALAARVRACRLCIENPVGKPLPHEPRPILHASATARICIIGQAPGTRVHASGRPFTDPSGDRLRDWMGIENDIFYDDSRIAIVPMGFCFPGLDAKGGDLPPRKECADAWQDALFELMPQLELKLLVGRYAQVWHLGADCGKNLSDTVRDWRRHMSPATGPAQLPLPHPSWRNNAWLRKNPFFEAEVLPVLRAEVGRLLNTTG